MERNLDKEYAGIMGYESFRQGAMDLAFGKEDENIKNKLVCDYTQPLFSGIENLRWSGNATEFIMFATLFVY